MHGHYLRRAAHLDAFGLDQELEYRSGRQRLESLHVAATQRNIRHRSPEWARLRRTHLYAALADKARIPPLLGVLCHILLPESIYRIGALWIVTGHVRQWVGADRCYNEAAPAEYPRMFSRIAAISALLAVLALSIAFAQQDPSKPSATGESQAPPAPVVLLPISIGDELEVSVFGAPDMGAHERVD